MHGDGTSLWTLTHHTDFARGFVPLLGHPRTIGEAFHITSDDALTWDQIAEALRPRPGVEARIVHVPSDAIAAADPEWGAGLLGDKAHSMVFDNSKLRGVVPDFVATMPFEQGAREIVAWHDEDPSRQQVERPHADGPARRGVPGPARPLKLPRGSGESAGEMGEGFGQFVGADDLDVSVVAGDRAARLGQDQEPRVSRRRPGSMCSTSPSRVYRAAVAAGRSRSTVPWQGQLPERPGTAEAPVTYAATSPPGSARGVKRGPLGVRGPIRSGRKVRQSSRSRSHATRYHRPSRTIT